VRIIAITNVDLFEKMQKGEFREDLYYALRGLQLEVPPLRERPLDLDMIIMRILKEKLAAYSRYHILTSSAKDILLCYYWSGNLLQLESFIDRMILSAKKRNIDEEYVQNLLSDLYPIIYKKDGENCIVVFKDPKTEELVTVLEKYHGDRALAAEELGISKTTLWRHMKKYGIAGRFKA
jgi:transcriptional regulator with PAS, ATPase and Fis domain